MQPIIHNLFPTPIYTTKINRGFTKQELNFVKEQEKHSSKNQGNINTKDNYILNRKEFKNIKKFLNDCCKDYIKTIICPKNNVELYITQSWLNYTKENEYHHKHNHGNSIVSGVLYFNANKDNDNITFFNKENYEQISPEINNNKFNVTIQYTENGGGTAQDTIDLELTNSEPSISVNETEVSISNTSIEDTQVFTAAIRNGTANTELDDKFLQVVLSNPRSADGTVLNAGSNIIDTTYYNTTETPPIAGPEFGINYGMFKHSIENGVLTVKTTGYFNGAWFFENTNINVEDNIPEMAASEEDRTITFTVYDGGVDFTTEDDGFTDSYKLAEGSMIVNRGGARIAGKMWKIEGDISNSTFTNTCSEDVWNMTQIDVWIEEWSGPEPFAENNNFILTIAPNNRVWLSSSGNDVSNYLPDGFYKYVSSTTEDVDNFGNTIGITSNYSVIEVEDGIIQLDQDCN